MAVRFTAGFPAVDWPVWLMWLLAGYGLILLVYGLLVQAMEALSPRPGPPSVSVLVVTRDQERWVEGAARRLVARYGLPGYEIVVSDDGSSDDTPRILGRLAAEFSGFFRLVPTPEATGAVDAAGAVDATGVAAAMGGGPDRALDRGQRACRGRSVILIDLRAAEPAPDGAKRKSAAKRETHRKAGTGGKGKVCGSALE